jgi:hypothetical protein
MKTMTIRGDLPAERSREFCAVTCCRAETAPCPPDDECWAQKLVSGGARATPAARPRVNVVKYWAGTRAR